MVSRPSQPEGTGTAAPGIAAQSSATRSSHHSSGPVSRISRAATAGSGTLSAAAAVPSIVMGGMTGVTARLAASPTRLSCPETAAMSGAVTSCAAAATHSASASGLGQRRAVS